MRNCCICSKEIEREDAPILTLGGAGYARLLCDECDAHLNTATTGRDVAEIKQSITEISNKISSGTPDSVTFNTVSALLIDAAERAKQIKAGTYDFSLDEVENQEGFDEIPEELRETEEDIEKDRQDEEKIKKFDKVYNILLAIALVALVGIIIWRVVQSLL